MVDEINPVILIEVHDYFSVRIRRKAVPASGETCPQLLEIVDLPVEHHDDRAVLILERLIAPRYVYDRQSTIPSTARGSSK